MASKFVYHATGDDVSNNGDAAGTPYATLGKAVLELNSGAPAHGDTIYVDYRHTESTGGTMDFLAANTNWPDAGGALYVVSSDFDVGGGTGYRKATGLITLTTNLAVVATAADGALDSTLTLELIGLRCLSDAGRVTVGDPMTMRWIDCTLQNNNSLAFRNCTVAGAVEYYKCSLEFLTTSMQWEYLSSTSNTGRYIFDGCTFTGTPSTGSGFLYTQTNAAVQGNTTEIYFRNMDLSSIPTILYAGDNGSPGGKLVVDRCKLHSSYVAVTSPGYERRLMAFIATQCSTGDITATPLPVTKIENVSGVTTSDTATYYTSTPANDGEQDYSLKLASGTNGNKAYPLDTPPMSIWHPGGDKTLTIRLLQDSVGAALKDDEIWVEGSAPGHTTDTGSATIGHRLDTRPSFGTASSQKTSQSVTASDTNDDFTQTSHGFTNGQLVYFTASGSLPSPIVATRYYFLRDAAANTFKVSTSRGGAAVDLTTTGSGVTCHPVFQTDTDATWTGSGTVELKFVVPLRTTEPGAVNVQVKLGAASQTVWVSPFAEIV